MSARLLLVIACLVIVIIVFFVGRNLYLRSLQLRRRLQMSDIFTNITHELLTPLTVISASVDKLRDEEPKFAHDYDLMQLNIHRMVRLLQQILETSKSEAGQLKLLVSQGDVMRYIRQTAECLEPLLIHKHQHFTITCYPESMMGWIDTDKLDKIIYNLLSNAAKYSNEGGEVALKVHTNKTFDHIRIEVSDTGDGISPEKMKQLFQRFHDGEYRKHQTIGTGLGLSLTQDLVYLHHGDIRCQSELGKGTTFTVELPINKEAFQPEQIDESRTIDFNIPQNAIKDLKALVPDVNAEVEQQEQPDEDVYRLLVVEDNVERVGCHHRGGLEIGAEWVDAVVAVLCHLGPHTIHLELIDGSRGNDEVVHAHARGCAFEAQVSDGSRLFGGRQGEEHVRVIVAQVNDVGADGYGIVGLIGLQRVAAVLVAQASEGDGGHAVDVLHVGKLVDPCLLVINSHVVGQIERKALLVVLFLVEVIDIAVVPDTLGGGDGHQRAVAVGIIQLHITGSTGRAAVVCKDCIGVD